MKWNEGNTEREKERIKEKRTMSNTENERIGKLFSMEKLDFKRKFNLHELISREKKCMFPLKD